MTKFKNILLIAILFNLIGCGVAGWQGYYQTYPKTTVNKYIAESVINSTLVTFADNDKMWLELPSGCNFFATTGVITPFTPPFPIFWLRNWHWDNSCSNFMITAEKDLDINLKVNNNLYSPNQKTEDFYNKSKVQFTFPVKAKNIDSGTIIIKKDGQTIEVPFEYKYFKFWH